MALNKDEIRFKHFLTDIIKNYISDDVIIELIDYLSSFSYEYDLNKSSSDSIVLSNGIDREANITNQNGYIFITEKISNFDDRASFVNIIIKINPTDIEDINVIYKTPDYLIKLNNERGILISDDDRQDFIVFSCKDSSLDNIFYNIYLLRYKKIVKQP